MPWRECIFTGTGVVYPASWDMNSLRISDAIVRRGLTASVPALAATPKQGPSDRIATQDLATQDLFSRRDDVPWSPAASSQGLRDGITTQDLFCRLTSAPESPATPSLPTDERAALPAEMSPCASIGSEKQKDSSPRCSSPGCAKGSHSISPLATLDFPSPLAIRGPLSPTATAKRA
ncbi:hypothetical protein T484DRAFT_3647257 [Baffinella frigidus]|nr:hypothetical protein T484DRAFT_3647257 [Cryptophyta sp. CCMP2293]